MLQNVKNKVADASSSREQSKIRNKTFSNEWNIARQFSTIIRNCIQTSNVNIPWKWRARFSPRFVAAVAAVNEICATPFFPRFSCESSVPSIYPSDIIQLRKIAEHVANRIYRRDTNTRLVREPNYENSKSTIQHFGRLWYALLFQA